jgi:hypothetical protein
VFGATSGRAPAVGPLVHPLPDPIASGVALTLQEFVTIPPSKPNPPPPPGDNLDRWVRINWRRAARTFLEYQEPLKWIRVGSL